MAIRKTTKTSPRSRAKARSKTPPPNPEIPKIGMVSSDSVWKHTGKGWAEWIKILEKTPARGWIHKEIAAFLKKKYRLTPWWQHVVAGGYEIHIGRKGQNRNEKGLYSLTATKAVKLPQTTVWKTLVSEEGQNIWLKPLTPISFIEKAQFEADGGYFGEVRTMKAPERVRLSWKDERWARVSYLQIHVIARRGVKGQSMLALMHEGLPDQATMDRMRARWKQAIAELTAYLLKK